ncbi:hypothetical protein BT96DRAFT_922173, partial [Gymnopus androsaceus JB14]
MWYISLCRTLGLVSLPALPPSPITTTPALVAVPSAPRLRDDPTPPLIHTLDSPLPHQTSKPHSRSSS